MHYAVFYNFTTTAYHLAPGVEDHAVKILNGRQPRGKRHTICLLHAKKYLYDAFMFYEGSTIRSGKPARREPPFFNAVWNFHRVRRAEDSGNVTYFNPNPGFPTANSQVKKQSPVAKLQVEEPQNIAEPQVEEPQNLYCRVCTDCGTPTTNYRCDPCWKKHRAQYNMDRIDLY